jgi:hypothetical protein
MASLRFWVSDHDKQCIDILRARLAATDVRGRAAPERRCCGTAAAHMVEGVGGVYGHSY